MVSTNNLTINLIILIIIIIFLIYINLDLLKVQHHYCETGQIGEQATRIQRGFDKFKTKK